MASSLASPVFAQSIPAELTELTEQLHGLDAASTLALLAKRYAGAIAFSTSFGWEDQVLTHLIYSQQLPIRAFTLDTGRMFAETYAVWNQTLDRYKLAPQAIETYFPQTQATERLVAEQGPLGMYESVEQRKACCHVRKLEPLDRALERMRCWATGIRREQSEGRADMKPVEWDAARNILKVHPLFDWTLAEVKDFIRANNIPYNPLHDKGFVSIGCAPCTRAIRDGEPFRAGRWWWEDSMSKECGLHLHSVGASIGTSKGEPHSQ